MLLDFRQVADLLRLRLSDSRWDLVERCILFVSTFMPLSLLIKRLRWLDEARVLYLAFKFVAFLFYHCLPPPMFVVFLLPHCTFCHVFA